MSFDSIGFALSLLTRSVIFLAGLFITCGWMARYRGSAFRSPYRLAVCPRFPFPRSAPLPAGRGGERDVCG